ncbi:MAG: hypothetical protein GXO47_08830 [Chlorobi bacterium]|nr:hypothetical protein [Chlorobiota bacterium]
MLKPLFLLFSILLILISGCNKGNAEQECLTGEWVSVNYADTLYIMDDNNFYHSTNTMHFDHYNFSVEGDSIVISYNGLLMVLVADTRHHFELNGDDLMIDFLNNQGFGFPDDKVQYKRIQKPIIE